MINYGRARFHGINPFVVIETKDRRHFWCHCNWHFLVIDRNKILYNLQCNDANCPVVMETTEFRLCITCFCVAMERNSLIYNPMVPNLVVIETKYFRQCSIVTNFFCHRYDTSPWPFGRVICESNDNFVIDKLPCFVSSLLIIPAFL